MRDTRTASQQITGKKERTFVRSSLLILIGALLALSLSTLPAFFGWSYFQDLPGLGRISLAIVIFAAFLWITEAVPAYAVSLWIISLNVLLLSYTGWGGNKGVNIFGMNEVYHNSEGAAQSYLIYLEPWAEGLMWLFMAGFILAEAMSKTKLDIWFARNILNRVGNKPFHVLFGAMLVTFILSMFMSNTATTAMMIAMLASFVRSLPKGEVFAKALYLGVPVAANVGGMGTIIGTPPNGLAVQALKDSKAAIDIDFLSWMLIGTPVAIILFIVGIGAIWFFYTPTIDRVDIEFEKEPPLLPDASPKEIAVYKKKKIEKIITAITFAVTVFLWMTQKLHGISTYVVALLPITVLSLTSIIDAKGFRKLPWDVLMLLAGGLSIAAGVEATGLDYWISGLVPAGVNPWTTFIIVIILAIVMSNLMSHTATASVLIPIAITMIPESFSYASFIVPIALTTSAAMLLPISTPPNAVAFASGRLESKDFVRMGLLMAVVGPIVAVGWGLIAVKLIQL